MLFRSTPFEKFLKVESCMSFALDAKNGSLEELRMFLEFFGYRKRSILVAFFGVVGRGCIQKDFFRYEGKKGIPLSVGEGTFSKVDKLERQRTLLASTQGLGRLFAFLCPNDLKHINPCAAKCIGHRGNMQDF